jgi:hypothetical protein
METFPRLTNLNFLRRVEVCSTKLRVWMTKDISTSPQDAFRIIQGNPHANWQLHCMVVPRAGFINDTFTMIKILRFDTIIDKCMETNLQEQLAIWKWQS